MGKITNVIKQSLILIIRGYQYFISTFFGHCCRFYPSCSFYAIDALKKHKLFYSLYLIFHRILRCHPWCQGGIDLVPEQKTTC